MQELSETEAAIFTVAQNNADMSIKELAKLARVRQHTARYALDKLIEERRLQLFPLIRFSRFGLCTYIVVLAIRPDAQVEGVMRHLRSIEGCSWTAFYTGTLAIETWLLAASPQQLQARLRDITEGLKGAVTVRSMTLMTSYRFYGRRYFSHQLLPVEPLESEFPGRATFEESDHLALQAIQAQYAAGAGERRAPSPLPDSTLRYRLARLRKEGILACVRLTVAAALRTREMVGLYISDIRKPAELERKLDAWARRTPELVSVCSGLGHFDKKVSVEIRKDSDLRPVLDSLLASCGEHIGSIESRVLMGIGSHAAYPFRRSPLSE